MPTLEVNNRELHYLDEGEGPTLLFGHSYLWDSTMWRQQLAALRTSYRCLVPDLWGHGQSAPLIAPLTEPPSIQSLADDHWALLQALDIERCCLIGLSVGGMWGVQLALDHPEAIERLVIMDSFVGEEPPAPQQAYLQILDMVEQAGTLLPPLIDQLIPLFLSPVTMEEQPDLGAEFQHALANLPAENIPTLVALGRCIFQRKDRMAALAQLKMPALVLVGELDQPRPPQEAKAMTDALEQATCQVIAQAGHISALEQPEKVNRALQAFLGACYSGNAPLSQTS
ncbi:MAG: alpha/beta hydrolase [Candidatus Electrothrix sp. GW3-4]|uniref:alpha/beta fold hydrolase n=1 Tax=Candidatus Electrothrix sp. GW3-4 TaxID=3126740 RepID=UPI0030D5354C